MRFFQPFEFIFILVLVFLPASQLQAESRLAASVEILNEASIPPLPLDSRQGWVPVAILDLGKTDIREPAISKRWRLLSRYEYNGVGGPATLQVRFRGPIAGPTFTHPWTEGTDITSEAYSNWFEDRDNNKIISSERLYVDARLIAPPRTPLTGKLYGIILEVWDNEEIESKHKYPADTNNIADAGVRYAYSQPLGTAPFKLPPKREHSESDALEFALSFVNSCLTGDIPSYYKAQANTLRSLDTGFAIPKYKQPAPEKIIGVSHIEEYKRRFDYKLYNATQFRELFPEWFNQSRPWIPSGNSYLFLGHIDRIGETKGIDYLVFLVEPDGNGKWKVIARPGL